MGCFWSSERPERCTRCRRKAVTNLVIINGVCECCMSRDAQLLQVNALTQYERCYGEYKCTNCGRKWNSRCSWRDSYQLCKRCKRNVYPHSQRKLRPSDMANLNENVPEHPKELCQMCQKLGYYCGKFQRATNTSNRYCGPQRRSKGYTKY